MYVMVFFFQNVYKLSFERLRWFGSAPACCGMLQFVCERGRSQFVRLFGFALFWAVQVASECLELCWVVLGRFRPSICIRLCELVILLFSVFISFRTSFYVVFGCFFLSTSFGVVLLFCLVFGSFKFFVDVFRIWRSVQIVFIGFWCSSLCRLFQLVLGCCGWLRLALGCCPYLNVAQVLCDILIS